MFFIIFFPHKGQWSRLQANFLGGFWGMLNKKEKGKRKSVITEPKRKKNLIIPILMKGVKSINSKKRSLRSWKEAKFLPSFLAYIIYLFSLIILEGTQAGQADTMLMQCCYIDKHKECIKCYKYDMYCYPISSSRTQTFFSRLLELPQAGIFGWYVQW